jgi:light-regulated signal transduction histidine kinase (bacteriophytochrome)
MLFAVTQPDALVAAVSENVAAAGLDPEGLIGGRIRQLLDDRSADRLAPLLRGGSIASSVTVQLRHPAPPSQWDDVVHRSGRLNLVELEPRSTDCDECLSDQARTGIERIRTGIERIRQSASVAEACVSLGRGIRALSGYDRVMVYRFDAHWNGEVVAEDKLAEMHPYFGHSFPASDIPAQARALYVHSAFRLIPDPRYTPCRFVPAIDPTTALRAE